MLGFLFSGLVKKFEGASKNIIKDFRREIGGLFDNKLYPLANKLDYITQQRIAQTIKDTEKLETKTVADINQLLETADGKLKKNLETIETIRKQAISETKQAISETLAETDFYLENRINQMTLSIMDAISLADDSIYKSIQKIEILENKLFQDANQIVDEICKNIKTEIEIIRHELKRYLVHALPSPLDKCRQKLKISWKPGGMLSDVELYELSECYELSKLNENTPIDEVLKVYGQLQHNAERMAALVSRSPELKKRAIQDWINYGLLCKCWRGVMESDNDRDSLTLHANYSPKLLNNNE
ncbi:MAG TPA: hypothetical protein IGS40_12890 [Trichormus sp. M33_DOE_039]|nr:hypothetical protein [Trichormus sp. M33_DOE_039]